MNQVAFSYLDQGMFMEAIQMDEEMLAMDPNFAAARWNLGIIHIRRGRLAEAIDELRQSVELSGRMPPILAVLAYAYAKSGDEANALAILVDLEDLRRSPTRGYASSVLIASVYEGLGQTEHAFGWLEQAFRQVSPNCKTPDVIRPMIIFRVTQTAV